jgi:hypothetical protein
MLLAQNGPGKLEDVIVTTLHKHEVSGPEFLLEIQRLFPSVTRETFYRTVRKLIAEEVVTRQNRIYRLNIRWLERVHRFSKRHIEAGREDILSFREGDKLTYRFRTPGLLSTYWAHVYDVIFDKHDPRIPILISHPHEWIIYTKVRSESFFLNRFEEDRKLMFFAIRGRTPLDKTFQKEWESEFRQIGTGISLGLKSTEYINVLGDFIMRISMSKKFSDDIDLFFEKYTNMTPESMRELERLCNRKDTARMVVVRSKKEAEKWRRKYAKYFYIPRTLASRPKTKTD